MPSSTPIGSRVGALCSINGGVARYFGEGVYLGEEVPSKTEFPHLAMFSDNMVSNPKILLDTGGVVWGCECWWSPVESMKRRLSSCTTIHMITPEEARKPVQTRSDEERMVDYPDDEIQSL